MYGTKWRRCRLSKKNRHSPWVEFFHFNAPKFPSSLFYWERRNFFQRRRWMLRRTEKLFFFKKDGEGREEVPLNYNPLLFSFSLFSEEETPIFPDKECNDSTYFFPFRSDCGRRQWWSSKREQKNLYSLKKKPPSATIVFPTLPARRIPTPFVCIWHGERRIAVIRTHRRFPHTRAHTKIPFDHLRGTNHFLFLMVEALLFPRHISIRDDDSVSAPSSSEFVRLATVSLSLSLYIGGWPADRQTDDTPLLRRNNHQSQKGKKTNSLRYTVYSFCQFLFTKRKLITL